MRHGRSPKPGSQRSGLDVEAEGGKEEVQNREAGSVDRTLKRSETRKKSKTGKAEEQIGC